MSDLLKRKGTFKITRELIENNPEAIIEVLKDVLVINVENDFMTNTLIYNGYSKHFDLTELNEPAPEYVAKVNTICEPWLATWERLGLYSEKDVKSLMKEILGKLKENQESINDNCLDLDEIAVRVSEKIAKSLKRAR